MTNVSVEQQNGVDIQSTSAPASTTAASTELPMAEYAKKVNAELRGQQYEVKPAVTAVESSTEASTAATTTTVTTSTEPASTSAVVSEEEDDEHLAAEVDPAKKQAGFNRKVGKLTAQREAARVEAAAKTTEAAEARREAEEAKAELARVKAEASTRPVVVKAEDDPAPVAPVRADFEEPDAFDLAVQKHLIDTSAHATRAEIRKANEAAEVAAKEASEAAKAKETEAQQAKVQEQITALHKTFNERVEKAAEDYPDYADKVTNNEKLILRNDVFFTIERSEMAPHLLYHLADNEAEALALNQMPPMDAAIRIGELQAEIKAARKPKPSQAKPPITPIGSHASPERKTPDEESMAEFAARRQKELKAEAASRTRH